MDTDLLAGVRFEAAPVPIPPRYQVGLFVVAVTMLVLPLLYVALVGLLGYSVWYHATHNYALLVGGGARTRVLVYVAPVFAGSLAVLFMVKPLFAPRIARLQPRALERADQPLLHLYVETLCRSLGAPPPRRIDIDMAVNASASLRRGLRSFLEKDLVLTLGLPLTAGLTVSQWTGVVAHEFGHFTQGAAMRFTYLIGAVNHWFARVVHERDAWDQRIEVWAEEATTGFGRFLVGTSRAFIWITRAVLRILMMTGLAVSSFLSRQMELHADLHQARVTGSRHFRSTHLRVQILALASSRVGAFLGQLRSEGRRVDDIVGLMAAEAGRLWDVPELVEETETEVTATPTHLFDTHPSTGDRIRAVEAREIPGRVLSDAPASTLFQGFDEICRQMTLATYGHAAGDRTDHHAVMTVDQALQDLDVRIAGAAALTTYFMGLDLLAGGVFPVAPGSPAPNLAAAREELATAKESMAHAVERAGEGAGHLEREPAALTGAVAARLRSALRLAMNTEIRRQLGPAHEVVHRLRHYFAVFEAMEPVWETVAAIQLEAERLQALLARADSEGPSPTLFGEIREISESLQAGLVSVRAAMHGPVYPYGPDGNRPPLVDHLFPGPEADHPGIASAALAFVQRFGQLYYRMWSDLATLALAVERRAGLQPESKTE